MNLIYAEVVTIRSEHGARMGKVRVRGALSTVPLHLVPEAQPGDTILVCDGVAIGRVESGTGVPPVQPGRRDACPTSKEDDSSKQSSIVGGINVSGSPR
jgi:hydrogenase maturation factor